MIKKPIIVSFVEFIIDCNIVSLVFPEMLTDVMILSITTDTVVINWTYQMNGSSPRTGVDIEIRRNGTIERTDMISSAATTATLSNLLPLTTYSITAFVVTDVGRSRPSQISASTLSLSILYDNSH